MKIYDLGKPSAEPERFQAADSIRFASYHQNDSVILSTYVDKPNIRYSSFTPACTVLLSMFPLTLPPVLSLNFKLLYPTHCC